jgi:hypothetical protein
MDLWVPISSSSVHSSSIEKLDHTMRGSRLNFVPVLSVS